MNAQEMKQLIDEIYGPDNTVCGATLIEPNGDVTTMTWGDDPADNARAEALGARMKAAVK